MQKELQDLTKAIELLTISINAMPTMPTGGVGGSGEPTSIAKKIAGDRGDGGGGSGKPFTSVAGVLGATKANPYIAAASLAADTVKTGYDMMQQKGMPTMWDTAMAKYTKPREKLRSIADDISESGIIKSDDWWKQTAKNINDSEVAAWQTNIKSIGSATSAMPTLQDKSQEMFDRAVQALEKIGNMVDFLVKVKF